MAEKTQTAKAAESTQVTKKEFTTPVSQWSNEITKLIARDYQECGVVFDDYSTNGVRVNGARIEPGYEIRLMKKDVIVAGNISFVVEEAGFAEV